MQAMEALRKNGKPDATVPGQGISALLVLLTVLGVMLVYCCWGRGFCRRSPDRLRGANPTIILLPYGRMLVVDGAMLAELQADSTGLDLIELGESVSTPDKENCVLGMPPPSYSQIFGEEMPPTYDEVVEIRESTV